MKKKKILHIFILYFYILHFLKLKYQNYQRYMIHKPNIITKQVSILPCVTMLLNELRLNKIYSKQDILNKWKSNKK